MSILDPIEETMANGPKIMELEQERELEISSILSPVSANRVVTNHNLSELLRYSLDKATFEYLSQYKNHKIVSIDCKSMTNADVYGAMATIAKRVKEIPDLIVIINNIAEVYNDPACECPQYVENLLGHSWKNDKMDFGECKIDASELTVILTATPEYKDVLGQKYRTDGYSWHEDFDQRLEEIEEQLKAL